MSTMERSWFGTDGIRGLANVAPMTPDFALHLGRALAMRLARDRVEGRPHVLIGCDTRRSGPMLEGALAAGLASAGTDVTRLGVVPTPTVAFLTRARGADAGIVVSASHNPFADNGIKIFDGAGFKLSDSIEAEIEQALREALPAPQPTGVALGAICDAATAGDDYVEFLLRTLPAGFSLAGKRVVFDGAHGAAHRVGPQLLRRLAAEVIELGTMPDGCNINAGCGATHVEAACELVRRSGASLGIVVDGDADRLVLVDESGAALDGDDYLGIVAAQHGSRAGDCIVGTVMSNLGLEIALRAQGIDLVRAAVGDRYVLEAMRRTGARLGGEPSGHLILLDHATTGDALLAAAQMLLILHESGSSLAELRRVVRKLPQVLVNVRVQQRRNPADVPALRDAIAAVTRTLDGRGRVLVRTSGTEPLVRIMVEGEDETEVRQHAEALAARVAAELSAPGI